LTWPRFFRTFLSLLWLSSFPYSSF
jgi:hypothetical protein